MASNDYGQPTSSIATSLYATGLRASDAYAQPSNVKQVAASISVNSAEQRFVDTKFKVIVPEDAIVYVNNGQTKTMGVQRQYQSALEFGKSYDFVVRVKLQRDGRSVEESRTVRLTGGQDEELAVNFSARTDNQIAARQ
jgi:uncharacterized protein (TIGR03000 family)